MPSFLHSSQSLSISSLRKRAKTILKMAQKGDVSTLRFLRENHPKHDEKEWTLVEVQHAIARSCNTKNWNELQIRCCRSIPTSKGHRFRWKIDKHYTCANSELARIARLGLLKHFKSSIKASKRLDTELMWIESKGIAEHFLVLHELSVHMEKKGILCGPGKGNDSCSIALFAIGATHVNPLMFGLEWERFFNPHDHGFSLNLDTSTGGLAAAREFFLQNFSVEYVVESHAPFYEGIATRIPAIALLTSDVKRKQVGSAPNSAVLNKGEFDLLEKNGALKIYISENPALDFIKMKVGNSPACIVYQNAAMRTGEIAHSLCTLEVNAVLETIREVVGYDLFEPAVIVPVDPVNAYEVADCVALRSPSKLESYLKNDNDALGVPKCIQQEAKQTRGVLLYQEQVMKIASRLGKLRSLNKVRFLKSFQKALPHNLKQQERFIKNASEMIGEKQVSELVEFLKADGWWFSRAHAVSYALLICALANAAEKGSSLSH